MESAADVQSPGAERRVFWTAAVGDGGARPDHQDRSPRPRCCARRGSRSLGDWFQLRLVYNQGAAFGLHVGPYSRWIFFTVALVAVFVLARMSPQRARRRPVPPARARPRGRRRGGQPHRPDPERPRRRGLPRRRHRRAPVADLQRRRHRRELRRHRAGDLPLAGRRPPAAREPESGSLGCLSLSFTRLRLAAPPSGSTASSPTSLASPAPRRPGWSPTRRWTWTAQPRARLPPRSRAASASTVRLPEHEPPRTLRPAAIPLTVVFEDEHLAVIDKPAGLVVHPAPGHWDDTLVNALVARGHRRCRGGAEGRPGIVHRLDRDTSGLMVVAKTDLAHRRLGAAIAARRVRRTYAALAWGHLDASPTVIEAPARPASHATASA